MENIKSLLIIILCLLAAFAFSLAFKVGLVSLANYLPGVFIFLMTSFMLFLSYASITDVNAVDLRKIWLKSTCYVTSY